jgi:hypothetical protein
METSFMSSTLEARTDKPTVLGVFASAGVDRSPNTSRSTHSSGPSTLVDDQ